MKPLRGLILLVTLSVILWPCGALSQNTAPGPDPILVAAMKAQREGRLLDAQKILEDGARALLQSQPDSPRLANYLSRLIGMVGNSKSGTDASTLDVQKLLDECIHALESTQPNSPQLANYLRSEARLIDRTGAHADAVALERRALDIDRNAFGPTSIQYAIDLSGFGSTPGKPGNSPDAEPFMNQALEIAQTNVPQLKSGRDIDGAGIVFRRVASLYMSEQRWVEAEYLLSEAKGLCDRFSPGEQYGMGVCINLSQDIAAVYRGEGRPSDFDPLYEPPPGAPAELTALERSERQYEKDRLYVQAEAVYRQAIAWIERNPTTETKGRVPIESNWLGQLPMEYNGLGRMLEKEGRKNEAEDAYKQAIDLQEANASANASASNPEPTLSIGVFDFSALLNFYRPQGRLSELEPIMQHALGLQEQFLGKDSTRAADTSVSLADLYREEGKTDKSKYALAVPLYESALRVLQTNLGPDRPESLRALTGYAAVLTALHDPKAAEVRQRIDAIQKKPQVPAPPK
jgi:tetratricopeptide (TPR) repeat protein